MLSSSWRMWITGLLAVVAVAAFPACQSAGNLTRGVIQAPSRLVRSVTSGQLLRAPGNILRNVTSDAETFAPEGSEDPLLEPPERRDAAGKAPATATVVTLTALP